MTDITFLDLPKDVDVDAVTLLAGQMQRALELLLPWCQVDNSSSALAQEIKKQALMYAQAIDFSIEVTHGGYTIAEEARELLQLLPKMTLEEKFNSLDGMREFTKNGKEMIMQAIYAFRNVRISVYKLIRSARCKENGTIKIGFSEPKLSKSIDDLEEFLDILSKFIRWWNSIEMDTLIQLARQKEELNGIRLEAIKSKWREHQTLYAVYCSKIGSVQDRYPELFVQARRTESQYYKEGARGVDCALPAIAHPRMGTQRGNEVSSGSFVSTAKSLLKGPIFRRRV